MARNSNKEPTVESTDNVTENVTKEPKKTVFYSFYNGQYISSDIVIEWWPERLNPATWKMERDDVWTKIVHFDNWIYSTSDELEIDFLSKYNTGWKLINGKTLKAEWFPVISKNEPWVVKEEKIVEKIVTKSVIPLSVLETLDEATLMDIAKNTFNYDVVWTEKKDILKEFKDKRFTV